MELTDGLTDDEATRKKKQNIVVVPSPSTSSWTQVTTGSGAQGTRDSIPGAPVVPVVNGGLAGSTQQPVAANIVQTKLDQNTFTYVPFVVPEAAIVPGIFGTAGTGDSIPRAPSAPDVTSNDRPLESLTLAISSAAAAADAAPMDEDEPISTLAVGRRAEGSGLDGSRASSPGAHSGPMSEAGSAVSGAGPQVFNMAAREMSMNFDQSRHVTINNFNVEALNQVQMQCNFNVERIRLEAAQALGAAEAVYNRLNADHERERMQWIAAGAEYQRQIFTEASQQVENARTSATTQLTEMRDDIANQANDKINACRRAMEVAASSHAADLQTAHRERDALRMQATASHQEALLARGETDGIKARLADTEQRAVNAEEKAKTYFDDVRRS